MSIVSVCSALPVEFFGSQYNRPSLRGVPVELFALSLKENGNGQAWAVTTTLVAEHLNFVSRHPLHVEEAVDVGRRKGAGPVCGRAVLLRFGGTVMLLAVEDGLS